MAEITHSLKKVYTLLIYLEKQSLTYNMPRFNIFLFRKDWSRKIYSKIFFSDLTKVHRQKWSTVQVQVDIKLHTFFIPRNKIN